MSRPGRRFAVKADPKMKCGNSEREVGTLSKKCKDILCGAPLCTKTIYWNNLCILIRIRLLLHKCATKLIYGAFSVLLCWLFKQQQSREQREQRRRGKNRIRITDGNKREFSLIKYPHNTLYTIPYRGLELMKVHAIGFTRQTDSCELPYTDTLNRMLLFDSKRHNILIY